MTIWEESPFGWFNDVNFYMAFSRNLIDAIWTEIIFRIMNRPSVIYYGACNEPWSTIGLFRYLPYIRGWMNRYDPGRIVSFTAASSQDWNPAFQYLVSVTPNTYGGTFEGERYAWDIEIANQSTIGRIGTRTNSSSLWNGDIGEKEEPMPVNWSASWKACKHFNPIRECKGMYGFQVLIITPRLITMEWGSGILIACYSHLTS